MKLFLWITLFTTFLGCSSDQEIQGRKKATDPTTSAITPTGSDRDTSSGLDGTTGGIARSEDAKNPYIQSGSGSGEAATGNTGTDENAAATTNEVAENSEEVVAANNNAETVEMYENYNAGTKNHDYQSDSQRNDAGKFSVFTQNADGLIAIYRCYSQAGTNHFISTNESCEANEYQNQGLIGYIYESSNTGISIYRCYNSGDFDHAVSDQNGDCPNGYSKESAFGSYPVQN